MATDKICAVEGCCKPIRAKGLCASHHARKLRTGSTDGLRVRVPRGTPCLVSGCEHPPVSKGCCVTHYGRLLRHGSPTGGRPFVRGDKGRWLLQHKDHAGEECLIWPFARYSSGYGAARIGGKNMHASRAMCTLAHGEPPTPAHEAAHSCANGHGGCCNPRHLRWATSAENSADMIAHGNSPRGARHGMSKLTEADVLAIRARVTTESQTALAKEYGVSKSHMSHIVSRREWAWLA